MPLNVLRRKLVTARRLPLATWALLLPVWLVMAIAATAIAVLPFRRLNPLLGRPIGSVSLCPLADHAQIARARRIGHVIGIAARYAPFRSDCLPQAMAAALLCRLAGVPYALFFGVAIDPDVRPPASRLTAHAWVISGPIAICGGNAFQAYQTISCYVSRDIALGSGPIKWVARWVWD